MATTKGLTKKDKELLNLFNNKLLERFDRARRQYSDNYLKLTRKKAFSEIEEELLDVAGWAILFWLKLKKDKTI